MSIGAICSPASATTLAGGSAGIAQQLDVLQRKYADIAGCATTPQNEKIKQESALDQQIQSLRTQQTQATTVQQPAGNSDSAGTAAGRQRNPYALVDTYA
ncbi:hypothetical protein SAMN02745857_03228 [Andreprevotia lacus DSM 23236]|uniref:FlxA-like protein n=1 Tax=Andreprevotia lacus DSM 23236 TaxID=1121001 RepID=A0A1W1XWR5_9NEIS|nr:hypothetical protein [Andreprevotia lacus]SMC28383.1 hypothetical protein SAMN02745857_03228 [Andreprevotia lacus DSM 23236]